MPSLRDRSVLTAIRSAFGGASKNTFRLLHYSVQMDHPHLLIEADEPTALTRGVQGLAIRVAKAINRVLGRHGAVWSDRFHARALKTPREVRNALVYILNNWRKHIPGARGLDACSSAAWFRLADRRRYDHDDGARRRGAHLACARRLAAAWIAGHR